MRFLRENQEWKNECKEEQERFASQTILLTGALGYSTAASPHHSQAAARKNHNGRLETSGSQVE
jgi:hypothetical protein